MPEKKTTPKTKKAATPKEGVSVQDLENFSKKYRFEIFFLLYFILATFFSFIIFSAGWSIYLGGLGAVLGVWLPEKVEKLSRGLFHFVFKQEKMTQIVLAVVGIIVSIFLPPLIFLCVGLLGGMGVYQQAASNR